MKVREVAWALAFGFVAVPIAGLGYDRAYFVEWVGSTDLEIEFLVKDMDTGAPIVGAEVGIHPEGGYFDARDQKEITLKTGADGICQRLCENSTCAGRQSGLRITNTYAIRLPGWWCWVSAPGYKPIDPIYLNERNYARQVQRVGPHRAKLVVKVFLEKQNS
jgi:hypothetical protein